MIKGYQIIGFCILIPEMLGRHNNSYDCTSCLYFPFETEIKFTQIVFKVETKTIQIYSIYYHQRPKLRKKLYNNFLEIC